MKKQLLILLPVMALAWSLSPRSTTQQPAPIALPADSAIITKGEATFNQYCTGCHNFKQDGIGPQLGGITSSVPASWIKKFVADPQRVIQSGDKRATQLIAKYKVMMPAFSQLTAKDLDALVAYFDTKQKPKENLMKGLGAEVMNPVPLAIKPSGLVAKIELVTKFPPSIDSAKTPAARITKLDYQPGTGSRFIVDLRGKLFQLVDNKPVVYMDIARLRPNFVDQPGLGSGFGSFAFHPAFQSNGLIYTTHTEKPGSAKADFSFDDSIKVRLQWVLTEWKADDPKSATFSGSGRELLRVNMLAPNHGVQEITFNPLARPGSEDYALLFIGIGDGGSVENGYQFLAHSLAKIWGTILRLDPSGRNSVNGHYGIPAGNPFAGKGNGQLGEIYAYGFRNPHRITWSKSGQMMAFNIGHGNIESIYFVRKGNDYGWPLREGNFMINLSGNLNKVYALPANDAAAHITYPVAIYDHDEGKAISGGYVYEGSGVAALQGKVLFGDIPLGRLFYTDFSAMRQGSLAPVKEWKVSYNGKVQSLLELCGNKRVDLHFGKDAPGELYILTKADGALYKIVGTETE